MKDVTEAMLHAALETEFEGRTVRGMLNSALWHSGAYGNAKDVVRSALSAALKELDEGYKDRATNTIMNGGPNWWVDELSAYWGGDIAPSLTTRRAAKTALRVIKEMDAALTIIAGGDGDPSITAKLTLEAIANG